jgi:hypothetical protein
MISDRAVEAEMINGAKRLGERKEAAVDAHPLFDEAESGQTNTHLEAFRTKIKNNSEGRSTFTRYWKDKKLKGDSRVASKNLTTRIRNPSRPVIHVTMAYWSRVLAERRLGATTDADAERRILHSREDFERVLTLAETYRHLAPRIGELRVGEDDLIEFRAV